MSAPDEIDDRTPAERAIEAAAILLCGAEPAHLTDWPLQGERRYCGNCLGKAEELAAAGMLVTDPVTQWGTEIPAGTVVKWDSQDRATQCAKATGHPLKTRTSFHSPWTDPVEDRSQDARG